MKELSVAVLCGSLWARAVVKHLSINQRAGRGGIRCLTQYNPLRPEPPFSSPELLGSEQSAGAESPLRRHPSSQTEGGRLPRSLSRKQADKGDAPLYALPKSPAPKTHPAASEDPTMMGPLERLAEVLPITSGRPKHTAGTEDSTMQLSAGDLARLVGATATPSPDVFRRQEPASEEDETLVQMTSTDVASALSQRTKLNSELQAVNESNLLVLAVPASMARLVLRQLSGILRPEQMLLHCIGGFSPALPELNIPALRISEVVLQETPITRIGALGGPALAQDLIEGNAAALVCGSESEGVIAAAKQIFTAPTLGVYGCRDLCGVEVARAMSSGIALASGLCSVLRLEPSTRALLASRCADEFIRLGLTQGAKEATFLGPSGLGSLLTAYQQPDSPDFQLGWLLGSGIPLSKTDRQLMRLCDSVPVLRDAESMSRALGLQTPILSKLQRWILSEERQPVALCELIED